MALLTGDIAETNTVAVFPWVIMQFRAMVLEAGTCGSVWRYFGLSNQGQGMECSWHCVGQGHRTGHTIKNDPAPKCH